MNKELIADFKIGENVTIADTKNLHILKSGVIHSIKQNTRWSSTITLEDSSHTINFFNKHILILNTARYNRHLKQVKINSHAKAAMADAKFILHREEISLQDEEEVLSALRTLRELLDKKINKISKNTNLSAAAYRKVWGETFTTETDLEKETLNHIIETNTLKEQQDKLQPTNPPDNVFVLKGNLGAKQTPSVKKTFN